MMMWQIDKKTQMYTDQQNIEVQQQKDRSQLRMDIKSQVISKRVD